MQERYEIRGKLGQGGLGAVYRAWDKSLKREVAIKRILTDEDGQADEATRQMEQETGALAALQHPHIVTIYDVGSDDDGPFVVMELIKGNTVDELVEKAPLTWRDFRELAMQIMEGLVAAQDLDLVHRDLKPSNIMINWLPSGKFQAKIVDFGLAKFSQKPSAQTLDHNDSVYGSIFFMAPEQFERVALDQRTDMYAIGCVYYFALAGMTPFQGDTGPQVMAAHLEHRVVPLAEVRPDVPSWVADWVMWHINRSPLDRPENAREALKNFIELDIPVTETMTTGPTPSEPDTPAEAETPKRPRLIIPGANPEPAPPTPAPEPPPAAPAPLPVQIAQPIQPVQPVPAAIEQPPPTPTPTPAPQAQTGPVPAPPVKQTAPQPLTPPEGAPPSVHTTAQQGDASIAETAPNAPPPAQPVMPVQVAQVAEIAHPTPTQAGVPQGQTSAVSTVKLATAKATNSPSPAARLSTAVPQVSPAAAPPQATPGQRPGGMGQTSIGNALPTSKKGLSAGAKIAIASILGVLVLIVGIMVIQTMGNNKDAERYNELVRIAADPTTKELPVSGSDLDLLLSSISLGNNRSRETVYKALWIANATDGTDVDARIAEFATSGNLNDDIRVSLLERVLLKRSNPAIMPYLLKYSRETENDRAAAAALNAVKNLGGEEEFDDFLDVIQFTSSTSIRKAAEKAAAEVLKKIKDPSSQAGILSDAAATAVNDDSRRTMIRLLGFAGGDQSEEVVTKALEGDDDLDKLAAIEALQNWRDDSMFESLMEFLEKQTDEKIRPKAFDAGYLFLTDKDKSKGRDDLDSEDYWKMLARNAKTDREQHKIISGLAQNETSDWALSVIEFFADEAESDDVIDRAEKALDHIRQRMRVKGIEK